MTTLRSSRHLRYCARVRLQQQCPGIQVVTASWEAAQEALVMTVLEAENRNLDLHIGIASWVVAKGIKLTMI